MCIKKDKAYCSSTIDNGMIANIPGMVTVFDHLSLFWSLTERLLQASESESSRKIVVRLTCAAYTVLLQMKYTALKYVLKKHITLQKLH
jgi:hypothetical protein